MKKKESNDLLQETEASWTPSEVYSILCKLVEMGNIQRDSDNQNNIWIYKNGGQNGDGWYSLNIFSVANEMMIDPEGIKCLLREIRKKDPSFVPEKQSKLFLSSEMPDNEGSEMPVIEGSGMPDNEGNGMTEDEALHIITQNLHHGNLTLALDVARKSISELQKYRSIGTVEEFKSYVALAEKLNLCDLVSENSRLANKIKHLEIQISSCNEKLEEAENVIKTINYKKSRM